MYSTVYDASHNEACSLFRSEDSVNAELSAICFGYKLAEVLLNIYSYVNDIYYMLHYI